MQQRSPTHRQFFKILKEDNPTVTNNDNNSINYFLPGSICNNNKRASAEITQ